MGECSEFEERKFYDCGCEDEWSECFSCLYTDYPVNSHPCQNCRYRKFKDRWFTSKKSLKYIEKSKSQ